MPAHKLHGRIDFQGIPVSIENRKGSYRKWYDVHNKTEGKTLMKFSYGYVRGTLGTDGDEVDVYIGPHKSSQKVFVITQMKTPDFKVVDEQKCMLGFDSAPEAKKAYLGQYNNPKFFGSMKEMTLDAFKDKLGKSGKLIKCAILWYNNTSENETMKLRLDPTVKFRKTKEDIARKSYALKDEDLDLKKKFRSESQRGFMHAAEKRGEVPKGTAKEFESKTPKGKLPKKVKKSFDDFNEIMEKAFTAASAAAVMGTTGRVSSHNKLVADLAAVASAEPAQSTEKIVTPSVPEMFSITDYGLPGVAAAIAQEQPLIGTNQPHNGIEPPVVPVRRVETPPQEVAKGEFYSARICGHMVKNLDACSVCATLGEGISPGPYWR